MQKYGLFSTGIDTRNSMTLVQMLPLKTNDRQGYYLASDVDARIAELEQALRDIAANCDSAVGGAAPRIWIPAAIKNLGL